MARIRTIASQTEQLQGCPGVIPRGGEKRFKPHIGLLGFRRSRGTAAKLAGGSRDDRRTGPTLPRIFSALLVPELCGVLQLGKKEGAGRRGINAVGRRSSH